MKTQVEILKEYGVTNYTNNSDGDTTINGGLYLNSLKEVHKDFLKDATINGSLLLDSLTEVHKDFLKDTTINGSLYLYSLKEVHKDFLKNTTINGGLYLISLTEVHKDFLKDTTINGGLYFGSLTEVHKDLLKDVTINGGLYLNSLKEVHKNILTKNVKQLKPGYNKEKGYCFFDNILSKVLSVKQTNGYTIYTTPFEFIVEKDNKTAHGKTVKKAIQDLEFKFVVEKIKQDKIKEDTIITEQHYRYLTGACENGIKQWKNNNNIDVDEIKAIDLLPILEKTNAYGLNKFKELIGF